MINYELVKVFDALNLLDGATHLYRMIPEK